MDEVLAPSQHYDKAWTKLTAYELPSRAKVGRRFGSSATPLRACEALNATPKAPVEDLEAERRGGATSHSMMPGSPGLFARRRAPSATQRSASRPREQIQGLSQIGSSLQRRQHSRARRTPYPQHAPNECLN